MSVVIIDSSYYNFYRFFATTSWYNYCPERKKASENVNWIDNKVFMNTFEKTWFENIHKISQKFNVKKSDIIFAREGGNVWRYNIFPSYKATRIIDKDNPHAPGQVFKHVNQNFHQRITKNIISVDTAEADDVIAVATMYIRTVYPEKKVIIITGDHDFLQLCEPNFVELYQLKGFSQMTCDNPWLSMMIKILSGDPSDNIPSIYKGCGKKTAIKLALNPNLLTIALEKHGRIIYDLNCKLVDFNNIPEKLVSEIDKALDLIL